MKWRYLTDPNLDVARSREHQRRYENSAFYKAMREHAYYHALKYEPTPEFPGLDIDLIHDIHSTRSPRKTTENPAEQNSRLRRKTGEEEKELSTSLVLREEVQERKRAGGESWG